MLAFPGETVVRGLSKDCHFLRAFPNRIQKLSGCLFGSASLRQMLDGLKKAKSDFCSRLRGLTLNCFEASKNGRLVCDGCVGSAAHSYLGRFPSLRFPHPMSVLAICCR